MGAGRLRAHHRPDLGGRRPRGRAGRPVGPDRLRRPRLDGARLGPHGRDGDHEQRPDRHRRLRPGRGPARTPAARSIAATGTARTSGVPLASGYGLTGGTAATGAGAATGFGTLPAGTTDGSTAYADTSTPSTTGTTGATSTTPGTAATTGGATTPRADLPPAPVGDGNGAAFGVATFNLLGASHTPPGGTRASGAARMVGALRVLAQHDVSVVGFQEMERSQHVAFEQQAKGWRSYPTSTTGKDFGLDTVAWRADTWQLVKAAYVMSPSWRGKDKPMPYVLLKHKASGRTVYVSTFHNEVGRSAQAQAWREEATRRQVALVNRLAATGVPQLLTGDMNERDSWFCRITGATRLHSATGGTTARAVAVRCAPTASTGCSAAPSCASAAPCATRARWCAASPTTRCWSPAPPSPAPDPRGRRA